MFCRGKGGQSKRREPLGAAGPDADARVLARLPLRDARCSAMSSWGLRLPEGAHGQSSLHVPAPCPKPPSSSPLLPGSCASPAPQPCLAEPGATAVPPVKFSLTCTSWAGHSDKSSLTNSACWNIPSSLRWLIHPRRRGEPASSRRDTASGTLGQRNCAPRAPRRLSGEGAVGCANRPVSSSSCPRSRRGCSSRKAGAVFRSPP